VLGIEVVLADGTIVTSLNKMLKNNAGYDLKHLFLGSEGTLGVITKLVLRLFPEPTSACTAFCGVDSYANAMKLLARCRNGLAGTLSAFEVMWPGFYELAQKAVTKLPLAAEHSYYVLLDALGSDQESDQARFQQLMENALEDGIVTDAVIAQSGADSASLWAVRDCVAEFPRLLGRNASFDISIPTGKINDFIEACDRRLAQHTAQPRTVWFGHVADSNVHLMARCEETLSKDAIEALVYETVRDWHGSVSAEHGIGLAKRPYLGYSRSPAELEVMHMLKAALDPRGILNPGKVLPLENPLDAQR
jgi:FAD/FMN-containing dehydrogenase